MRILTNLSILLVKLIFCVFVSKPNIVNAQQNKTSKPNVVFIFSDQHKLEATGAYGSKIAKTPNIDSLAKKGVVFNHCYTPSPVCAPARAALITGMYPYANGAIYHKAPVKLPSGKTEHIGSGFLRSTGYHEGIVTLAEIFRQQNYITASPGKMHVHGELQKNVDKNYQQGNDLGFDEISVRYYTHFPGGHYEDEVGEDTYMRYRQFQKYNDVFKKGSMHLNEEYAPTLVQNDEDNFDMVVAKKSVDFINKRGKDGQPFFLHVGFEKPHPPFTTAKKYLDQYQPNDFELPITFDAWYGKDKYPWCPNWVHSTIPKKIENAKNVMAAYHACVTEMDDMVGRVIEALKKNNLLENTIIIYTSDHGEHLFEHGLRGKHNMYEDAVNVPFIISFPKMFQQNVFNNTNISLIDLMPTLAELIGAKVPSTAQGISLVNLLKENQEIQNRTVFSEFRGADYLLLPGVKNVPSRMMKNGDFKFIYTHGIIQQLYDLKNDPDELNNLIFNEKYQKKSVEMYFKTMATWRFQEYFPIQVTLNQNNLTWHPSDDFEKYVLFYSKTNNFNEAFLKTDNITKTSLKLSEKGFYWILAYPKLTKTTSFYGEKIPVAVEKYSYTLPISDKIELK